tara:strand:- start:255 stop:473 length:219 start_codon:yes stop_codon:yes gene_type:complete
MSSEQSINIKSIETPTIDITENDVIVKTKPRVDINHLLSKLREKEKSQKKENLFFFGLVGTVVIITGIIASL